MKDKVEIVKRDNDLYPYSIKWMGQEQVLLKRSELAELYSKISHLMVEDKIRFDGN